MFVCVCAFVCLCVFVSGCVYVFVCVCERVGVRACLRACVDVRLHLFFLSFGLCVYVCVIVLC